MEKPVLDVKKRYRRISIKQVSLDNLEQFYDCSALENPAPGKGKPVRIIKSDSFINAPALGPKIYFQRVVKVSHGLLGSSETSGGDRTRQKEPEVIIKWRAVPRNLLLDKIPAK